MEPSAPWFLLACLCLLSSVLLPSAVGKFRDWRGFVAGVVAYQVGPPFLARAFGWALPLLESLLLVGLWWTPLRAVSSLALLMLLLLFMGAVVVNLRRGSTAPCFCAGTTHTTPISWGIVVRNGVLALICLWIAMQSSAPLIGSQPVRAWTVLLLSSAGCWLIIQYLESGINLTLDLLTRNRPTKGQV